jgi:hypothetical protein
MIVASIIEAVIAVRLPSGPRASLFTAARARPDASVASPIAVRSQDCRSIVRESAGDGALLHVRSIFKGCSLKHKFLQLGVNSTLAKGAAGTLSFPALQAVQYL